MNLLLQDKREVCVQARLRKIKSTVLAGAETPVCASTPSTKEVLKGLFSPR